MFPGSVIKLDNGLTFIHQEISTTSVVVADVWVRAGTNLEPEPWFGMAHFLEHMIFKGTPNLLPGEFDYHIEKIGGVSNAATSHDYAHYSITTAANHLEHTLPHLGELLLNAAIPDDEFIRERDVVLEEIRTYNDDPDWVGFQSLVKNIYQHHPYGRSVLGTEPELMQHSPEAMRCFYRTHYQPENMTVVVVGGIGEKAARELVNRTFANFPQRDNCPQFTKVAAPVIKGIRRHELILPRLEQARLMMGWKVPGAEQLRAVHGLELLSALLGAGRISRLVSDLREEKQLVQDICCDFSLQKESSLLTITAWLESEYLERVEELICNHLQALQNQEISTSELNRIQRFLCNDYAFSTETPNQLTNFYGYYHTIANAELAVTYPQEIQSFHPQELQKLAQQYLSPANYAVTILQPC
ncbi:pitrilysin family protein [Aphanizomenon sp. CS-733/32]|uniref:M16 family metallopeptidase n=1 Tax=Aphanizomenon sp. CS-733/32 TaxID=3021715 RepID=UPI002330F4EE|nr:pitrilysin family protein [Aphanizomenon sp. CS-733/32]MDB9309704.1 pitrilysin family protein [Aphanizomenon sp. CS-733/32]